MNYKENLIKKWEVSKLLDGLTPMDMNHPMLTVITPNKHQKINDNKRIKRGNRRTS